MAAPHAYRNSTGVDFSPPSPVDTFSPSSRRSSATGHENSNAFYVSSPVKSGRGATANDVRAKSTVFNIQPPTAPRSMRQNISPPPPRRLDAYRSGRTSGFAHNPTRDEIRREPRRYSDDISRNVRSHDPTNHNIDRYLPASPRRREGSRYPSRDRSRDHSRDRLRRRSRSRDNRYEYDEHYREPARRRRGSIPSARISGKESEGTNKATPIGDLRKATYTKPSEDSVLKGREAAELVAARIIDSGRTSSHPESRGQQSHGSGCPVEDGGLNTDLEEGECYEAEAKEGARPGLAMPQVKITINIPSRHDAYAPHLKRPDDQPAPNSLRHTATRKGETCVDSIEEDYHVEPRLGVGSSRKPLPPDMTRPSREDIASTPSTGTTGSRNKDICRACRKPGGSVTELVPCKLCQKGYHNCCGNPKPRQSERPDDFVCGRCMRKQKAAVTQVEPRRSSLDHHSPPDTLVAQSPPISLPPHTSAPTPDTTPPNADAGSTAISGSSRSSPDRYSPSDALVLDDPPFTLPPHTPTPLPTCLKPMAGSRSTARHTEADKPSNMSAAKTIQKPHIEAIKPPKAPNGIVELAPRGSKATYTASESHKYKHITCPNWKRGGCRLMEAHCIFAHNHTGCDAPYDNSVVAKEFTCPLWRKGRCHLPESQCLYSHNNTHLYIGTDGKPCVKHITCWFWKFGIGCRLKPRDCLYAHEETGEFAWQPVGISKSHAGKHPFEEFRCPRFEADGRCRFQLGGNCPYTHAMSAKPYRDDSSVEQGTYSLENRIRSQTVTLNPAHSKSEHLPSDLGETEHVPTALPAERATEPASSVPATAGAVFQPSLSRTGLASNVVPLQSATEDPRRQRTAAQEKPELRVTTEQAAINLGERQGIGEDNTQQPAPQVRTDQAEPGPSTDRSTVPTISGGIARRGGLRLRPPSARIKMAPIVSGDVVQSKSQSLNIERILSAAETGSPDSVSSKAKLVAVSSGSIERKICEGCPKQIFSAGTFCKLCLKIQEDQQPEEGTTPGILTNDTIEPMDTPSIAIEDDFLDSPEVEPQTKKKQPVTSGASREENASANARKRVAMEDHMFVPNKRRRNSQTTRRAAISALRQGSREQDNGISIEINISKSVDGGVLSLETLTDLVAQEKAASERYSTEEANETPSTRQQTIEPFSNDESVDSSLMKTTEPPPYSPIVQTQKLDPKPSTQVLGKRPRRSSSITSAPNPSIGAGAAEVALLRPQRGSNPPNVEQISYPTLVRDLEEPVPQSPATSDLGDHKYPQDVPIQTKTDALKKKLALGTARKHAPAPGMLLSKRILTEESDQSDIERNDGEDEADMTLSNAVDNRGNPPVDRLNLSPDNTPTSDALAINHSHASPLQSHASSTYGSPTSSREKPNARHLLTPRCPRCIAIDKRCWHKMDCSPDPVKCRAFIEDYGVDGPPWFSPSAWNQIRDTAHQAMLESFIPRNLEDVSILPSNDVRKVFNNPAHSEDGDEDQDEEDEVQPIRFASSNSSHIPRNLADTTSKVGLENSKDVPIGNTSAISKVPAGSRSSYSHPTALATSRGASRTVTEGEQTIGSRQDAEIERMKARGVMFESDSEDDEAMEEDCFRPPPPARIYPLWQRPARSRNLFDIDPSLDMSDQANRSAAGGVSPTSVRPPKKELMGNLLLYQCAERKQRFGNPHQEVRRFPKEVLVSTVVQRGIDFDAPKGVQANTERVTMTFREFLGAPKEPVIEARKDQLVFREKKAMPQSASKNGRARRVMDPEVFPFLQCRDYQ